MERSPISLHFDFSKKKESLYFKKIIIKKNNQSKFNSNNSFSINKNPSSYFKSKKLILSSKQNSFNIKSPQKNVYHNSSYSLLNIQNTLLYKKIKVPYINLNNIIYIQKNIRGFIVREKLKKLKQQEYKKYLYKSANPKHFINKININILKNLKNKSQKKNSNNSYYPYNTVNNKNLTYKKNIINNNKKIINKQNSNNNNNNTNKNSINEKTDLVCDTNNNSNDLKMNIVKKNDYQISAPETDFSMSNFLTEQCPQIINYDNDSNENENNLIDNIKVNEEYFEAENMKIYQIDGNMIKNNNTVSSYISSNKNKNNLIFQKMPSHSTNQTKENTSFEKNIQTENYYLESPHNKHSQRTERDLYSKYKNRNNQKNQYLDNENKEKKEDKNLDLSIDNYLKDEFDTEANYENNKKSLNLINSNMKYNFNPLVSSKINLKNIKNINYKNKNINNNNYKLNLYNNDKKINESIREEKYYDISNDLKSIKSSFYDEDEFIIINYDYSLNDKKKYENSLKTNSENKIIKYKNSKIIEFINLIKKLIYKNINIFVFNIFKEVKIDNEVKNLEKEEDEKSLTDNDSCSYIPQGRIQKNKIIFNFAQKEMRNNINHIKLNSSNKKIKKSDIYNSPNDGFRDIEFNRKKINFYSP